MNSLLVVVELILSVFLEKKTRKNSKNSSLSSSQTEKDETSKLDPKSKGRGKISNTRVKDSRYSQGANMWHRSGQCALPFA